MSPGSSSVGCAQADRRLSVINLLAEIIKWVCRQRLILPVYPVCGPKTAQIDIASSRSSSKGVMLGGVGSGCRRAEMQQSSTVEGKMSENVVIADLVENSVHRRTWLLYKALETVPIDNAIALARAADEFVTGSPTIHSGADCSKAAADLPSGDKQALETATDTIEATTTPSNAEPARAQLSADQRERLIERLAAGATNPELASEFGLSCKQVQGFRMGLARKGTKRREEKPQPTKEPRSASTDEVGAATASLVGITAAETRSASADEVVRYLRQRDDVVVPQGEGKYLVNARFELTLPELIDRANKMLNRQGKPAFKCENNYATMSGGMSPGLARKHLLSTISLN